MIYQCIHATFIDKLSITIKSAARDVHIKTDSYQSFKSQCKIKSRLIKFIKREY